MGSGPRTATFLVVDDAPTGGLPAVERKSSYSTALRPKRGRGALNS